MLFYKFCWTTIIIQCDVLNPNTLFHFRTLANYLIWNVASTFSTVVSPDYGSIYHVFLEAIYGNYKRKERWRECVASTSKALSMGVGKLFIEEKFDDHKIKKVWLIIPQNFVFHTFSLIFHFFSFSFSHFRLLFLLVFSHFPLLFLLIFSSHSHFPFFSLGCKNCRRYPSTNDKRFW